MPNESTIMVSFPGLSPTEASRSARDLADQINQGLREEGLSGVAQQHRTDLDAQDLGQVVEIILSAPAILVFARGVAQGIQKYMARTNRSRIQITHASGEAIVISDVESRHLEKIIAAISRNGL